MVQFLGISEEILPENRLAAIQWADALTGQIVFFALRGAGLVLMPRWVTDVCISAGGVPS